MHCAGGLYPGGSAQGVSAGGVCPGGVWQTPPPVNRMTDRCKNITLRNFVAGGNKEVILSSQIALDVGLLLIGSTEMI